MQLAREPSTLALSDGLGFATGGRSPDGAGALPGRHTLGMIQGHYTLRAMRRGRSNPSQNETPRADSREVCSGM
ncbi:MAG TPA: hypothetical protein VLT79_06305 [Gemmatimonadales bacterium]|nr:hypothetical protein [Gemmatimonadales bacterium]